jgi:RNase P/RNase MRP subunit p30
MLQNGKLNIIEDLKEQFNENIYLILIESAQEKMLQHGTKNKVDELLEVV